MNNLTERAFAKALKDIMQDKSFDKVPLPNWSKSSMSTAKLFTTISMICTTFWSVFTSWMGIRF